MPFKADWISFVWRRNFIAFYLHFVLFLWPTPPPPRSATSFRRINNRQNMNKHIVKIWKLPTNISYTVHTHTEIRIDERKKNEHRKKGKQKTTNGKMRVRNKLIKALLHTHEFVSEGVECYLIESRAHWKVTFTEEMKTPYGLSSTLNLRALFRSIKVPAVISHMYILCTHNLFKQNTSKFVRANFKSGSNPTQAVHCTRFNTHCYVASTQYSGEHVRFGEDWAAIF